MISVAEALSFVEEYRKDFGTEVVTLLQSNNRILAEDIFADRDFPPYDRVTMDGIAIDSKAFNNGRREFKIEKIQAAGAPQQQLEANTDCIEVMTGAMLPKGTDSVVPYEDCAIERGVATVKIESIKPLQNIHQQGTDSKAGALLVAKGKRITATTIAIMATVGMEDVTVKRLPTIAICTSGDELVDVQETPLPHQIRKSNSYMLMAALAEAGIIADTYHLPDDKLRMQHELETILPKYEAVLFSGAVSKGKYDFLPEVLTAMGMQTIFHRIAQRPGKPFLFGQMPGGPTIFGFPGNPASTLVCYKVFFERWLSRSLYYEPTTLTARLSTQITFKPALTYHLLVNLRIKDGILEATPCPGSNSGDMVSLERADAIISLPPDQEVFEKGTVYEARLLTNNAPRL